MFYICASVRSVRANVAIKMFDSFTRPGSFTSSVSGEDKEKCEEKRVNCTDMAARRDHLDALVRVLEEHITARVNSEATEVSNDSHVIPVNGPATMYITWLHLSHHRTAKLSNPAS